MRWARPLTIYNLVEVVRIINICGLHMIFYAGLAVRPERLIPLIEKRRPSPQSGPTLA